jgi:hypothetical protein
MTPERIEEELQKRMAEAELIWYGPEQNLWGGMMRVSLRGTPEQFTSLLSPSTDQLTSYASLFPDTPSTNRQECERCRNRRWVPIEGTITAAIEAIHHGRGRVPCPECSAPSTNEGLRQEANMRTAQVDTMVTVNATLQARVAELEEALRDVRTTAENMDCACAKAFQYTCDKHAMLEIIDKALIQGRG